VIVPPLLLGSVSLSRSGAASFEMMAVPGLPASVIA